MPDKSPALTVKDIEQAVRAGKTVRWRGKAYVFKTTGHKFLVNIPINELKYKKWTIFNSLFALFYWMTRKILRK